MQYQITVTRTESAIFEIEAENIEDAKHQAIDKSIHDYENQFWETNSITTDTEK